MKCLGLSCGVRSDNSRAGTQLPAHVRSNADVVHEQVTLHLLSFSSELSFRVFQIDRVTAVSTVPCVDRQAAEVAPSGKFVVVGHVSIDVAP